MTREEILNGLYDIKSWHCNGNSEMYSIIAEAIKALEQEPVLDKIRAEIEAIIGERNLDDYDFCSGLICARNILDKYKVESEE